MSQKLTEKQRRFAEHFAAGGNMTAAARAAGYKGNEKTLCQVGRENMEKPGVAALIESLRPKTPGVIDIEERQRILSDIANGKINEETHDPLVTRMKAIDLLNKMQGVYVQRVEHSGPGGSPIEVAAEQAAGVRALLANEEARDKLIGALETLSAGAGSGTA